jgi:hypothetical protein
MVGKIGPDFPMIGKNFRQFSNDWKKFFQWLEKTERPPEHNGLAAEEG